MWEPPGSDAVAVRGSSAGQNNTWMRAGPWAVKISAGKQSHFAAHTPSQLRSGSEPCHQPRQPADVTVPFPKPGSNEENKSSGRKSSLLPARALQLIFLLGHEKSHAALQQKTLTGSPTMSCASPSF